MFAEHFDFHAKAIVDFVGGGGKTSLILRLLEEYASPGPVVYTTTTRIHPPRLHDGMILISCDHPELLKSIVLGTGRTCAASTMCKVIVAGGATRPNYLQGVDPGFAAALDRELFQFILNEADGARSMSLKMPREGEPVLMDKAEYLVPVIGLDCLLKPLGPGTLFRWELVAERFSAQAGQLITPQMASDILLDSRGVCKDWKPGSTIIPYINKVDDDIQDSLAKELALALLNNPNFPVERVVWGSLEKRRVNSLVSRLQ